MAEVSEARIARIIGRFKLSEDKGQRMLGVILDEVFTKTPEGQRRAAVKQVVDGLKGACQEFIGKVVVGGMLDDMAKGGFDVGETAEGSTL